MVGSIRLLSCASGQMVWLLGEGQRHDIPNVAVLLIEAPDRLLLRLGIDGWGPA